MYIEDIEEKYAINKIESCLNKIESLFETGVRRLKNQKPDDFRFICLFILRKSIVSTAINQNICNLSCFQIALIIHRWILMITCGKLSFHQKNIGRFYWHIKKRYLMIR